MKKAKKILICAAAAAFFLALIYALLFTTAEIPGPLLNPVAGTSSSSEKHTALVFKRFRPETLQPGDLILVVIRTDTTSTREVAKLEKIQFPSESQRLRARGRGRAIGQAILDMDFKPHYWVSTGDPTNSPSLRIPDADIKGKVVHTFRKKRT